MNLPHLPPILFAQNILSHSEKRARVECSFPFTPTLPMLIEAAAQSSSCLSEQKLPMMGFLAMCKDVHMHKKPSALTCIIYIEKSFSLGKISEFLFQAFNSQDEVLATGSVTIVKSL